jgi:hypothetical protein
MSPPSSELKSKLIEKEHEADNKESQWLAKTWDCIEE